MDFRRLARISLNNEFSCEHNKSTMNFKSQLRELLRSRGMTAADLSRVTGIPKQSISDWLAGVTPRDLKRLKKVAEYFGVTVDQIVFGDNNNIGGHTVAVATEDGGGWVTGIYEVRFRRIDSGNGKR